MKKLITVLAVMIFLLTAFAPIQSQAANTLIDITKEGKIDINFRGGAARFRLYKVGSVDAEGYYTMEETFASHYKEYSTDANGDLNTMQQERYTAVASNLLQIVRSKSITPTQSMMTAENGTGTFSKLDLGIYLLVKDVSRTSDGKQIYQESAQLVRVPGNGENGQWNYEPVVVPKALPERFLITKIKVEKQWDFESAEDPEQVKKDRQKEIVVKLVVRPEDGNDDESVWPVYKGNDNYDYSHIVLNESNNWSQTFENLALEPDSWTFIETNVPKDFTVEYEISVNDSGAVVVVTNTYNPPTPPDTPTTRTRRPPDGSTESRNKKLPQTGQLWWPVQVLAAAGVVFIIHGIRKNKKYRSDIEE